MKYIIVRANSTSGTWIVERKQSNPGNMAIISTRTWGTREMAQKAADRANAQERKAKEEGR